MYAGEALMMMDKAAEARDHLDPTFVGTLNAFDFETRDWQLKSVDAAQNVVRYNLAVAMALPAAFATHNARAESKTGGHSGGRYARIRCSEGTAVLHNEGLSDGR